MEGEGEKRGEMEGRYEPSDDGQDHYDRATGSGHTLEEEKARMKGGKGREC